MSFSDAIRRTFASQPRGDEMRPTGTLDQLAGIGLITAGILYLYFDALGGVVRWIFSAVGLVLLLYVPALLAIVSLAANALVRIGDPRTAAPMLGVIAFLVIEVMIAVLLGRSLGAALFELYIWMPAFVVMALTQRRMQDRVINAMAPVFFIAVVGVLLNTLVTFPWADATYEVMGVQREIARQWQAGGVSRLAGFSRASYAAAAHILIGYCVVEHRLGSSIWKWPLWVAGLAAIHFTTSKSPEATMLLLPFTYLIVGRIRGTGGARRQFAATAFVSFWLALVCLGPFLALTYGQQIYPAGVGVGRSYSSLADRVLNMWPEAIALIDWRNPVAWVVGRGLGGIGTPLSLFEPSLSNSADNVAIYLFVTLGLVSLGLFYLVIRGAQRAIASGDRGRRDFVLIVAMLGIGSAANVIEAPVSIMILGLALARYERRPRSSATASAGGGTERVRRVRRSSRSSRSGGSQGDLSGEGA